MIQDLVWKDMPRRFSRLAGLVWCVANAMIYGYQNSSWAVFLQLAAISGACVHALQYNDHKGLLSLHSSTLFMNAASNFVYGIPNLWGTSVSIVLAFAMLWLDTLHVPFNLSAFRGRSVYSQGLPLMIHGTTPLIIVYSAIETLMKVSRGYVDLRPNDFVRATLFLLGVYGMATQYAGVSSSTVSHRQAVGKAKGSAQRMEIGQDDGPVCQSHGGGQRTMEWDRPVRIVGHLNDFEAHSVGDHPAVDDGHRHSRVQTN